MYVATILNKKAFVTNSFGKKEKLELSWIKGQVGALPVFKTLKDARAYVGKDGEIFKIGKK